MSEKIWYEKLLDLYITIGMQQGIIQTRYYTASEDFKVLFRVLAKVLNDFDKKMEEKCPNEKSG